MAKAVARRRRTTSNEDAFRPDPTDTDYGDEGEIGDEIDLDELAVAGEGWGSSEAIRKSTRTGPNRITVKEGETVLVKVLQAAPFVSYATRHFKSLQRTFVALAKDDPLDGFGEDPRAFSAFNAVPLASDKEDSAYNADTELEVHILAASPSLTDALKKIAGSKRGPLNRDGLYLEINYEKKDNGFGAYEVAAISADEVEELWNVQPLTKEDIAGFEEEGFFTSEHWPYRQTRQELEAAAAKLRESVNRRAADPARRKRRG